MSMKHVFLLTYLLGSQVLELGEVHVYEKAFFFFKVQIIHSFNKSLLNVWYVLGTVLGAEDSGLFYVG